MITQKIQFSSYSDIKEQQRLNIMVSIMKFMADDHDRLDGIFKQFKTIKNSNIEKAREMLKEFKTGLERHIVWEEELLFPAFESKTGISEEGPTAVMRTEHTEIKSTLEKMYSKITSGDNKVEDLEQDLLGVLGPHNDKEEEILYPWIDQSLSEAERNSMLEKMKRV